MEFTVRDDQDKKKNITSWNQMCFCFPYLMVVHRIKVHDILANFIFALSLK